MIIDRLDFVTSNPGKVAEFAATLEPQGIEVCQRNLSYPEIQADTLQEVVRYGLAHLTEGAPRPRPEPGTGVCIEDSGLFVEVLGGYPGVYSKALYVAAGPQGLLRLLQPWPDPQQRGARFETVIGLLLPELPQGSPRLFEGRCVGTIAHACKGEGGFGFDPVFVPEEQPVGHGAGAQAGGGLQGQDQPRTFAQMTREEKNALSHRGRALEALVDWLKEN